jgi:hypothetical protein
LKDEPTSGAYVRERKKNTAALRHLKNKVSDIKTDKPLYWEKS